MRITLKYTGLAGILAGIALACELSLFMVSGWTPEKFSDPSKALELLEHGGVYLQAAAGFGILGLALMCLFLIGLAEKLKDETPTLAGATLYFGLIGVAGHSLVPVGLWMGIPALLSASDSNAGMALEAWTAFRIVLDGAQGVGSVFMGLSMLATGWASAKWKVLPAYLGWLGIAAGAATLFIVLSNDTRFAGIVIFPSILLTIVFRIWAGNILRKTPNR